MLITRVELENIKSYRQLAVDFRRGATAISGSNGAGKTTILEAIGYALFDYLPYNQGQFVRDLATRALVIRAVASPRALIRQLPKVGHHSVTLGNRI